MAELLIHFIVCISLFLKGLKVFTILRLFNIWFWELLQAFWLFQTFEGSIKNFLTLSFAISVLNISKSFCYSYIWLTFSIAFIKFYLFPFYFRNKTIKLNTITVTIYDYGYKSGILIAHTAQLLFLYILLFMWQVITISI